ncbi:envelope glycoprotein O [Panine betaherpesvirus 2]|uniref:Envelope glycoprotein O n=1 Tax=Panine betaherpesvirus 2 TaxID=188763 RepID=Q8QS25_9BETA|nr:envelope glycoprotein O [Panine betaherpesvirus 2]AAM00713.1 envelope glycoprotein O [Panine betaherpesvirus 2]QXV67821.1 envelope glycoprotein O [Panine betaherpesvirus 2]
MARHGVGLACGACLALWCFVLCQVAAQRPVQTNPPHIQKIFNEYRQPTREQLLEILKLKLEIETRKRSRGRYKVKTIKTPQTRDNSTDYAPLILNNVTVAPMPKFPKRYILAGPKTMNVTYLWLDFYSNQLRRARYVYSKYDNVTKNITFLLPPCGNVPSMRCLSEMLNISISRRNETGENDDDCRNFTTYNPMLYNVPRWNTLITVGSQRISVDSQTVYFMGLSALILRYVQRNCTSSFYLANAMSRNMFRVPKYFNSTKLKNTMRKLKRKQTAKEITLPKTQKRTKRNATVTTNNVTTTTIHAITTSANVTRNGVSKNASVTLPTKSCDVNEGACFKNPILATQLQDLVTWVYSTFRYYSEPYCQRSRNLTAISDTVRHTHQVAHNQTPSTIYGTLNLTSLYQEAPEVNRSHILLRQNYIDPLWDYIDSMVFKEEIRNRTNITLRHRPENVSSLSSLWW